MAWKWLTSFLHGQEPRMILGERVSPHPPPVQSPKGQSALLCCSASICTLLPSWCGVLELGLHQYADETQLYLLMDRWTDATLSNLAERLEAIVGWLNQSQQRLNPVKTEVLWLSGVWCQLPALDGMPLTSAVATKNLDMLLDASLTMEIQVTEVARMAFLYVSRVKQMAPFFSRSDLASVISELAL